MTLCGDGARPSRGMLVKLRLRNLEGSLLEVVLQRSWCRDPEREILHRKILAQRSCTTRSCCKRPDREILHNKSAYRDLAQVVIQDPDAEILTQRYAQKIRIQRSCTSSPIEDILTQTPCARDPHTPILHKRSCRILLRRSSTPRARYPHAEILHKRSHRPLMQRS